MAPDVPPFHRHFSEVKNHIQARPPICARTPWSRRRIASPRRPPCSFWASGPPSTGLPAHHQLPTRPRVNLMQDGHTSCPPICSTHPATWPLSSRGAVTPATPTTKPTYHQQGAFPIVLARTRIVPLVPCRGSCWRFPRRKTPASRAWAWVAMIESLALWRRKDAATRKAYAARADESYAVLWTDLDALQSPMSARAAARAPSANPRRKDTANEKCSNGERWSPWSMLRGSVSAADWPSKPIRLTSLTAPAAPPT